MNNENLFDILQKFKSVKISDIQIDPFGYCNAKCWFCPVSTHGNITSYSKHMELDMLEKILQDIYSEKLSPTGIISSRLTQIHTAHYNEILLYKYFEEFLQLLSRFDFKMVILSNGVNLTPQKIDIINKYSSSVSGIHLNIPAFERELWAERTGMRPSGFDSLIDNIKYAETNLQYFVHINAFTIGVNCPTAYSMDTHGGAMTKMQNFPSIDLDPACGELQTQISIARSIFPSIPVNSEEHLHDRAGMLDEAAVFSNAIKLNPQKRAKAVGCEYGSNGRIFGWLNINSKAETFLCCNDFKYEYVFGNLLTHKLRDVWLSRQHAEVVDMALANICTKCIHAVWENHDV